MVEEWWKNGQLKVKEGYLDGRLHGVREGWYRNGQLETKENYVHGKLHGRREYWYPSGEPDIKENYLDGNLQGSSEEWDGEIWLRQHYINGNKVSDKEYQEYQKSIHSVLNKIIQIKALVKFTLHILQ